MSKPKQAPMAMEGMKIPPGTETPKAKTVRRNFTTPGWKSGMPCRKIVVDFVMAYRR